MLERVKIDNFRCLKSADVTLRPLTVLVGLNDTGKSAFLSAVQTLFLGGQLPASDHWRLDRKHAIHIEGHGEGGAAIRLARGGGSHDDQYTPDFTLGAKLGVLGRPSVALYALPSTGPVMYSEGLPDEAPVPPLAEDGSGVPGLIDFFLRRDRGRFDAFVNAMRTRVPGLVDVHVGTPKAQNRRIDLRLESGMILQADRASSGVRLMLFFLALTYHPSPPSVILLEEPENGVHPRRLADIMRLLRDITKGVHCGHPAQVVLTTHSPYLLDHVNLDEDQVLVFRRNDDGSRTCEPVDRDRLKTFLDDFMLGEVWFNQQEEGLIKQGG